MKYLLSKDTRYRKKFNKIEFKKSILKAYIQNLQLPISLRIKAQTNLNKHANKTRTKCKNRCPLTKRGRSISRIGFQYYFRTKFRADTAMGLIPGITKSSW